jgi:two-component system nitrate/nitrite response regulator NarL
MGETEVPEAATVLIVDDHRIVAEALTSHLRQQERLDRVEFALSLPEARVALRSFSPHVVLLDEVVGGEPGTDLIVDLALAPAPPRVVMVSAGNDSDAIIDALDAGVDAWVGKDARVEVLMAAIEEVLAGHMYLAPPSRRPVLRRLLEQRTGRRVRTFVDDLSPRELEVLRCLVAGLTRAETAGRLYLSPNTVRTHVQNLLKRADVHSTVALVAAARQAGVQPADEPEPTLRQPDRMVRST